MFLRSSFHQALALTVPLQHWQAVGWLSSLRSIALPAVQLLHCSDMETSTLLPSCRIRFSSEANSIHTVYYKDIQRVYNNYLWCLIVNLSLSHVISWVGCGTWLYWFLIFAVFQTFPKDITLNINPILSFIINMITQLMKHLNISPASIVRTNTVMHVVLYIRIGVNTVKLKNCLSIACVAQWAAREYNTVIF